MGAGVSCELWCFPLLVGCARHSATGSGGCWCSLRGTCGEVGARGQGVKGVVVGVSREHWRCPLSLGRLCEAQRDRQWMLLVQPLLLLCEHVARWSPACGERALAGRARGALMRSGVSASVSLANTGASLSWSAVRGTARQAVRVAGAAAAVAVCTRGEVVACVRGARTCWKSKWCAHEEGGVGGGVSCEHWPFRLLVVYASHSATGRGGCWCSPCCCSRAARWSPACGECVLAGRARGARLRRRMVAPVPLASTGASLSWSAGRGTARQAVMVAGAAAAECTCGEVVA